jgi:hypothetical protein
LVGVCLICALGVWVWVWRPLACVRALRVGCWLAAWDCGECEEEEEEEEEEEFETGGGRREEKSKQSKVVCHGIFPSPLRYGGWKDGRSTTEKLKSREKR